MIGNDIIDLTEARLTSNWQRRGFLEKVFNPAEQRVICVATDPFQTVWRMWSMKESAYKLYLQKNPAAERGFYPAKINTELITLERGRVSIHGVELMTKTETQSTYLFSTAFSDSNVRTKTKIFYLPEKNYQFQSTFTKEKLLDYFVAKERLERDGLEIRKNKNKIPQIFYKEELLPFKCSLTHHGNYGGFSVSVGL